MCSEARAPRPQTLARRTTGTTRIARGFTLPETILAILVIGIGLAGILMVMSATVKNSADPMVRRQMGAIATELMEEIQLKPYAAAANGAAVPCGRDTYNDVSDYHGYATTGICTVDGVAITNLASYSVSVSVAAGTLNGVAAAKRIAITVSHAGSSLQLVGWRTDYAPP